MRYVTGGLVVLFMIVMLVGGLTGRIKAKSCCATPDPAQDARMRME
ncbi:MAG TPA: hypothetical protein VMV52_10130 [Candidatus Nanopelagicaceae bacterium]|nr:hypothetical protein [Candidatus Nanopelagicaceae bacterium]